MQQPWPGRQISRISRISRMWGRHQGIDPPSSPGRDYGEASGAMPSNCGHMRRSQTAATGDVTAGVFTRVSRHTRKAFGETPKGTRETRVLPFDRLSGIFFHSGPFTRLHANERQFGINNHATKERRGGGGVKGMKVKTSNNQHPTPNIQGFGSPDGQLGLAGGERKTYADSGLQRLSVDGTFWRIFTLPTKVDCGDAIRVHASSRPPHPFLLPQWGRRCPEDG
jgi:hypothetical protein